MTTLPATTCVQRLQLRPGVSLITGGAGELRLVRRGIWRVDDSFGCRGEPNRSVVRTLAAKAMSVRELEKFGDVTDFVEQLRQRGWLTVTVTQGDRDLYTLRPLGRLPGSSAERGSGRVLSRFAVLRREGEHLVVESPLARASVSVRSPEVAGLVATLSRPIPRGSAVSGLSAEITDQVLRDLRWAGLLVEPGAEEADPDLQQWSPHDFWFHARSRNGSGGYGGSGFGRTNWGKRGSEPMTTRRDPFPGPGIELHRPDLAARRLTDPPLTAVVEDRCTVREHADDHPITADQLGELLYRCARVRFSYELDGTECLSVPYPSGGSVYELELYPVVRRVDGLAPGMYHFDAHEHRLRQVRGPGPEVARLLWTATAAAAVRTPPQVLIVMSARFGRLMRTYEGVPYSLVLKHVGVLYQTMYLVATSLGLAPAGLGAGDATAFTSATGLDPAAESSVGDFLLGSRPATVEEHHGTSASR